MNDKVNFKGHVTIQVIDKSGKVIDQWLDDNMIMEEARANMASLIGGMNSGYYINKIVLGTEGHNGDYLTPKTDLQGFVKERTELFSEESAGFNYPIVFSSTGLNGNFTIVSEPDTLESSTVSVIRTDSNITYTIDLPGLNGNGSGTVVYTEAALYAGTSIFSMKCFKGKIKDDSVKIRIIWSILF